MCNITQVSGNFIKFTFSISACFSLSQQAMSLCGKTSFKGDQAMKYPYLIIQVYENLKKIQFSPSTCFYFSQQVMFLCGKTSFKGDHATECPHFIVNSLFTFRHTFFSQQAMSLCGKTSFKGDQGMGYSYLIIQIYENFSKFASLLSTCTLKTETCSLC